MSCFKQALIALALLVVVGCNSTSPTTVGSIRIDPANTSVQAGQSAQLVVIGENGSMITDGVSWISSSPVRASVTSTGVVTGGYGSSPVTVTAATPSASATTLVDVLRLCAVLAPIHGSPDPAVEFQSFDVEFTAGTDGGKRANQLAERFGFSLIQVTKSGFSATLTPQQAAGVGCASDVASMTYL